MLLYLFKNVIKQGLPTVSYSSSSTQGRFTLDLVDADGAHAYPILGYTYMILRMLAFTDCERATQLYRYIHWFSTSDTAQRECQNLYMASLSAQLARRIESEVLSRMRCRGEVVSALVAEQIDEESRTVQSWVLPVSIIVPIALLLVVIVTAFLTVQQLRINRAIWKKEYLIPVSRVKILIYRNKRRSFTSRSSMSSSHGDVISMASIKSDQRVFENRVKTSTTYQQAIYNEQEVHLRKINLNPGQLKLETKRTLLWMRDKIHHLNVLEFYGICLRENATFIVSQSCSKGILRDTLQNDKFNLDINFKFSMSCDLGEGLHYLHKQDIYHGAMTSSVCLIDGRWTVKICDWEIGYLMKLQSDKFRVNHCIDNAVPDENIRSRQLFWSAPEVLLDGACRFTEQADVYSLGIIIIEIFTREDPFDELSSLMEPKEIIEQVATINTRPLIPKELPMEMQSMLEQCWDPQPKSRPTAASVVKTLNAVKPSKKSVLDCMMSAVENYAVHLEEEVEARTVEVKQTMTKLQLLLHQILPPTVADKLSCGESVDPEFFDSVTVFFSDIVGFTALSSESSAFEIVTMLNELYTQFDSVIDKHEVYKVETIGDAYMCVSGCPNRNGDKHAEHIAKMAINLAIASANFRISHVSDNALRLRVGIHSGPVAAGVVGLKMPRYCLFGDTVNTAARMESTSVAMKIQVSEETKDLLDGGNFILSDRKEIEVKGKGRMKTYWLHGLADSSVTLPPDYLRDCD